MLITGAASGIGRALALALAEGGAQLILVDQDEEEGGRLSDETGAEFLPLDIRRVEAAVEALSDSVSSLDGLVHVAGVADEATFPNVSVEEWDRVHQVNLRAPFFITQALADRFGSGGSIVNVASVTGSRVVSVSGRVSHPYSSSKGGLLMLTRTLAAQLAPRGIRVNSVSPGFVRTPIIAGSPELDARVPTVTPLERWGKVDDVVDAIRFLLSSASAFVTGAEITVDGGLSVAFGGRFNDQEGRQ